MTGVSRLNLLAAAVVAVAGAGVVIYHPRSSMPPLPDLAAVSEPCGGSDSVIARVIETHGETLQGSHYVEGGDLIATYANRETGTWTVLAVKPDDRVCIIRTGRR